MEPERRVVIYGAGAIGGYIGGRLAARNPSLQVALVGRPPLVDAISAGGLTLREAGENRPVEVHATADSASLAPADLVILTVRTFDVASSLPDCVRLLTPGGRLLALQNGVGIDKEIAPVISPERLISGTLTTTVRMDEPGIATRVGGPGGFALAPYRGEIPMWVTDTIRSAGLPVLTPADYRSLRWSKLLLNLIGAAGSAILDMDMGPLMRDPVAFRIEQLAAREAGDVMDVMGVGTMRLPGYPVPLVRVAMRLPAPLARATVGRRFAAARGGRSPAMRADMQRGRTEVCYFNGAVARTGYAYGISTPVNAALTRLTEELAANAERRPAFRGNPAALAGYLEERGVRL